MRIYFRLDPQIILGFFFRSSEIKTVILLGLTLISTTPAKADIAQINFSAEDLVEACMAEDPQNRLLCMGYTRGVLDGMFITQRTVCVGYDVPGGALATRIVRAGLQFAVEAIADDVLLGLPARDLTQVEAADFVRWAFISTLEGENPTDFRCSN